MATPTRRRRSGCRRARPSPAKPPKNFGTPGATAVWADENTREGIFDAIKRKETYGTSGPLIRLRFFGGWGYPRRSHDQGSGLGREGVRGRRPHGRRPARRQWAGPAPRRRRSLVQAIKDPESGNLDRVQIIKGWYQNGHPWERSTTWCGRTIASRIPKTGKLPPVGNTVDIKNATYTNSIGDTQLSAVWTDPDFDPALHAVYYVRVHRDPDAALDHLRRQGSWAWSRSLDVPATIQERAWSSPIWYTPDPSLVKKPDFYPGLKPILH